MSPSFNVATVTTLKPAMTALAGFVPWADCGIRQHFGFAVIGVENRMSQKRGIADGGLRNAEGRRADRVVREIAHLRSAKNRHQRFDVEIGGSFVECDADRVIANGTQIAAGTR